MKSYRKEREIMIRRNDMAYDVTSVFREIIDKMYREELGRKIKLGKMQKSEQRFSNKHTKTIVRKHDT